MTNHQQSQNGVYLAIAAFVWWGLAPIYFKTLTGVDAFEIMAHRMIWSVVTLIPLMLILKRSFRILKIFRTPKLLSSLLLTGVLISTNWLIFVWAISNERVLETSLGYFINPLVSVALGILFLGERLNLRKYIALGLVALAVANQIWQLGELPWVSLSLAFSFGFYGLLRKQIEIDSFNGLLMEIIIATPFAIGFFIWKYQAGDNAFFAFDWQLNGLLMLTGIITIVPMALFAASVKKVNLSTIGFIQYLAPSLTFLLAIFLFKEPLGTGQLLSFSLIWIALIFISWEAIVNIIAHKKNSL